MKREFEFSEGTSNKFWHIELDGTATRVHFGRIGTAGQTREKDFGTEEKAKSEFAKQISSKVKKGYVEVGSRSGGETGSVSAGAEPVATKETPAKQAPAAARKKAPEKKKAATFSSEVLRKIDLTPAERMVVTWEEHEPLERPEPKPLFSPGEIIFHDHSQQGYWWMSTGDQLRTHVLPFLTADEKEELRSRLKGQVGPYSPQGYHDTLPLTHHAAAWLGMQEELRGILSTFQDDQFKTDFLDYYNGEREVQWLVFGLESPEAVEAEFRRLGLPIPDAETAAAAFATTGLNLLDVLATSVSTISTKADAEKLARSLKKVDAPEAATPALRLMLETKAQKIGIEWLMAHPVESAVGLADVARGQGKLAEAARDHLMAMSQGDQRGALEAAVPNLEESTAEWLKDEILGNEDASLPQVGIDELSEELRSVFSEVSPRGKLPPWLMVSTLPPIKVEGGRVGQDALETLLRELKSVGIGGDSKLAPVLKKHAEPNSLDAFVWKVFEGWLHVGAQPKEKWALGAIGHLGGDDSVLKLTPMLREWPGQSQHQRAVLGLDCLRQIGSETALMALNGIAQKLKYKGLKEKAQIRMREIAEEQGMTPEELADRIVPDCGLDERGCRTFDFGPRKFDFIFGPELKPKVRDEAGKVRVNLPRPNKSDDPEKAEIALADWKLLKKTLREALKIQNVRMEEAMITGRRWGIEDFKKLLIRHPLMVHLVQMLVWGSYDEKTGDLTGTFRVTEDLSAANADDDDVELPAVGQVGIIHPAHLSESDKSKWGEVLSDYEIIPPFQQLGRTLYSFEPQEASQTEITRFKGPKLPGISLYGILERSHWLKDTPADAGGFMQHSKYFSTADITAFIQYEPGLSIGYYEEEQTISSVYFVPGHVKPDWWGDHKHRIQIDKVDSVVLSEVLRMAHLLASKGG